MQTKTIIRRYSPPVLKIDTIPKPVGLGLRRLRQVPLVKYFSS